MNIYDILRKLGYDIHSFNENGVYTVSFSPERIRRYSKMIELGEMGYDGDLFAIRRVKVGTVHFNELGNLFVDFVNADNIAENIDCYEHGNMAPEELY